MDKKDIYVITNLITGTQYVGQSKDANKRFLNHKTSKDGTLLHQAMQEYGTNNFIMEIIEPQTTNYNELEKYWISKLDTLFPNGYNMTKGGEGYPHMNGECCYQAKITEEEFQQIINLLQNTSLTQTKIGNKFNVTQEIISNINLGRTYYHKNLDYPIRKDTINIEIYNKTVFLLQNTLKSLQEIGNEVGKSKGYVNGVNQGKINFKKDIEYPIRKIKNVSKLSDEKILLKIKELLEGDNYSTAQIGALFNVQRQAIEEINQGKSHFHSDWNYPIRKQAVNRNKLPKETVEKVYDLLKNTNKSYRQIAKELNIGSHSTISGINMGTTKAYYDENINYPIRKPF